MCECPCVNVVIEDCPCGQCGGASCVGKCPCHNAQPTTDVLKSVKVLSPC